MMHIAERISRLGTETAFEVLVRARALEAQGKSIVHLEIGEPDFDTPQNIIDAAKKLLMMASLIMDLPPDCPKLVKLLQIISSARVEPNMHPLKS